MRGRRLDDRAHDERARAEFVQEVLPVDLNVSPCQLRAGGITRHTGQHGSHVLRADLVPVQSGIQVSAFARTSGFFAALTQSEVR